MSLIFFLFVCFFFLNCLFTWCGIYPLLGASFFWFERLFFRNSVYFTHKHTDQYTLTHTHTHTQTHTHTHTHTHIHMQTYTLHFGNLTVRNRDSYVCCLATMSTNYENMYNAVTFLCFVSFGYN